MATLHDNLKITLANRWYNHTHSTLPRYHYLMNWINNHMTPEGGIQISHRIKQPYPEVTGYLIPSLLRFGHFSMCHRMLAYLRQCQQPNGAWLGSDGVPSAFDTGQVLKGLLAMRERIINETPGLYYILDDPITRACQFIVSHINDDGTVKLENKELFRVKGFAPTPNEVHVYAMAPLIEAAHIYKKPELEDAATRVIYRAVYLDPEEIVNTVFSHFSQYIAEGLIDCDYAVPGSRFILPGEVQQYQSRIGYLQSIICLYKTGQYAEAERRYLATPFTLKGSRNGVYFPRDEPSWSVKFNLDVLYWRQRCAPTVSTDPLHHDDPRLLALMTDDDLKHSFVLDAGCGTGRYMEWLGSHHTPIVGMDIKGGKFTQGELANIPYMTDSFDCVYCVEALEHAVNQEAAVDEMSRVAKKKVIIIDKCAEENGKMRLAPMERWPKIAEVEGWLKKHWGKVQWRWIDDTFVKWVGND